MAKILGLDVSTYVGMACLDPVEPEEMRVKCVYFPDLKGWLRLQSIAKEVRRLIEIWKPDTVLVEGYAIYRHSSVVAVVSCGTVVRGVLYDLKLPWMEVPPSTLKKWTTGNGKATKDDMAEAVSARFGFTSKSDDVVDAVALAQLGVHLRILGGADPLLKGISPGW